MNEELQEKTQRIGDMLAGEDLDAVLLNAQHNFAWLTCGGSNGIDLSRENGAANLLVTADGRRFVIANNIEMPRILTEEVAAEDFDRVEFSWQDEKATGDLALRKAKELLGSNSEIATDIPLFSAARPIENKIAACRYRFTSDELIRYRQLGQDSGAAIRRVIDKLELGQSEHEIAELLRHELASAGMTSVVTLVAADDRISNFRHPVPTAKLWRKTLLLVTCAKRGGMLTSQSRMICSGEVPGELKRITEANAVINASLVNATRPGTTGAELYSVAAKAYAQVGYADEINRHHQGGSAGYKTREWVAHPQSTDVVQLGQPFAWNPSITGTKVEETCVTTANGVEVVTASPDFPKIASTVNGREYSSPGILSL